MVRRPGCTLFAALLLTLAPQLTAAQNVELPPAADPASVPATTRPPRPEPPARPSLEVRRTVEPFALAAPITLTRVEVRGATVVDSARLADEAAPYIGRLVGAGELSLIADRMSDLYEARGYDLSHVRVAAADPDSGVVTFEAVEGYVSQVRFVGLAAADQPPLLGAYAERIMAERPLRRSTMQRYLYLMDDLAGITTSASLEVTRADPGAVLEIRVNRRRGEVFAEVSNVGSRYIGPVRASVSLGLNDPGGLPGAFRIGAATTPGDVDELVYGYMTWRAPLGRRGSALDLAAAAFRSEPDVALPAPVEGISGEGVTASAALRHPFIRAASMNLRGFIGYNHEDVRADLTVAGQEVGLYEDRLRSLAAGLSFDRRFAGPAEASLSAGVRRGLDVFDASGPDGRRSRPNAPVEFTAATAEAAYRRGFGEGSRWSLSLAASGQYAFDPLLASEEFSIGGPGTVRGLEAGEISGDSGLAAGAELRYDLRRDRDLEVQAYGFAEYGEAWNRGRAATGEENSSVGSAGLGTRLRLGPHLRSFVEVAVPTDGAVTKGGRPKALVGISLRRAF